MAKSSNRTGHKQGPPTPHSLDTARSSIPRVPHKALGESVRVVANAMANLSSDLKRLL